MMASVDGWRNFAILFVCIAVVVSANSAEDAVVKDGEEHGDDLDPEIPTGPEYDYRVTTMTPPTNTTSSYWPQKFEEDEDESGGGLKRRELVFVAITQEDPYSKRRAEKFEEHINEQVKHLHPGHRPMIRLAADNWAGSHGQWTLLNMIDVIVMEFSQEDYSGKKWVIFCEDETRFDVHRLTHYLNEYDEDLEPFIGRPLADQRATIIHHYANINDPTSFLYPDLGAGIAISFPFLEKMVARWLEMDRKKYLQFSIDAKFEMAKFIKDEFGVTLIPACAFCADKLNKDKIGNETDDKCKCVTWQPVRFPTDCVRSLTTENLYVAVKTCTKFHEDRVPVVMNTWGPTVKYMEFYSDSTLDNAATSVVTNTEHGHCGKTRDILRDVGKRMPEQVEWLLIADDDTIINIEFLLALLACYKNTEPVCLGERYGYNVAFHQGYNYITGGAGIVLNHAAVKLLAAEFECPTDDSPDDMILGMFFAERGIDPIHSRYFHQARPEDYSPDFLATQIPVSFHKHWNTDPYKVYKRLTDVKLPPSTVHLKEEL